MPIRSNDKHQGMLMFYFIDKIELSTAPRVFKSGYSVSQNFFRFFMRNSFQHRQELSTDVFYDHLFQGFKQRIFSQRLF